MGERGQRAIGPIRHPRPEHIVDRVSAHTRRQPGDLAVSEIPGHPEPVVHVPGSCAAKTLATRSAGVKPNVLIAPEYFGLGVVLGPNWYHDREDKYSKNQ